VNTRLIAVSAAACTALVLLFAWWFGWEVQRAMTLAPVLVIAVGAAAGVAVVLGKALGETLRSFGHPRLLIGLAVGLVGVVVVLSLLGVQLPRE
jgi:hypothetical protein